MTMALARHTRRPFPNPTTAHPPSLVRHTPTWQHPTCDMLCLGCPANSARPQPAAFVVVSSVLALHNAHWCSPPPNYPSDGDQTPVTAHSACASSRSIRISVHDSHCPHVLHNKRNTQDGRKNRARDAATHHCTGVGAAPCPAWLREAFLMRPKSNLPPVRQTRLMPHT